MLCKISLFAPHDLDVMAEFPQEYSSWVDGGPVSYYRKTSDLSRQKYDGIEQTRTVTNEGLQSPVNAYSSAYPPKYPPHQLNGYNCEQSVITDIYNHPDIVILSIDTVDPADYDSLPNAMKWMRPDDVIKDYDPPEDVWTRLYNWLVGVTPEEHKPQVETWLSDWYRTEPNPTARNLGLEVRRFTS